MYTQPNFIYNQVYPYKLFVESIDSNAYDKNKNLIILYKDINNFHFFPPLKGINIKFFGHNNIVILYENIPFSNTNIHLFKNNFCIIESTKKIIQNCFISFPRSIGSICYIKENFNCFGVEFKGGDGKNFYVGKNVLMSYGISIWNGDGHAILNDQNVIINEGEDVIIGDNCWIGHKAEILKGSILNDGTIVGAASLVTKKFLDKNIIIAGNPAKIIKRNVFWSELSPLMLEQERSQKLKD